MKKIAVLYQYSPAPMERGIIKPMKFGGYSDSGADLAFSLKVNGLPLVTPSGSPDEKTDKDWVFPDTIKGIKNAIDAHSEILWANTVLYRSHPIFEFRGQGIEIVGQDPSIVDKYDNKLKANKLMKQHDIPVPQTWLIKKDFSDEPEVSDKFPLILKPVKGRGSQGVVKVFNEEEMTREIKALFTSKKYGTSIYAEKYLRGREITLTVMPPGKYHIGNTRVVKKVHWSLPPVERFNHIDGIAPYSGHVAVLKNSKVMNTNETASDNVREVIAHCELASSLIQARAPVRIDCREDDEGKFHLFDLNLKPNMTGPSRVHRKGQDSLTVLAAKAIGWSYHDLLLNVLNQKWEW